MVGIGGIILQSGSAAMASSPLPALLEGQMKVQFGPVRPTYEPSGHSFASLVQKDGDVPSTLGLSTHTTDDPPPDTVVVEVQGTLGSGNGRVYTPLTTDIVSGEAEEAADKIRASI